VKELAGAGTDIDQVIISPMGNNKNNKKSRFTDSAAGRCEW
jgi:hypothetical protein